MFGRLTMPQKVFGAAAISSIATLGIAAAVLVYIYRVHEMDELDGLLMQDIEIESQRIVQGADGTYTLTEANTRSNYDHNVREWVWQLIEPTGDAPMVRAQSRSLGPIEPTTEVIPFPKNSPQIFTLDNHDMRGFTAMLTLEDGDKPLLFGIAGTMDHVHESMKQAVVFVLAVFSGLAVLLSLAMYLITKVGLRPLHRLRTEINKMHEAGEPISDGRWPEDLRPVVDELRELEERNTSLVERHRRQANDLAHTLKTPLTVLSRLASGFPANDGNRILEQTGRMTSAVRRNLTRLRTGAIMSRATPVHETIEEIVFAMDILFRDRELDVRNTVGYDLIFRGHPADLEEVMGNLLENASKFAKDTVLVEAQLQGDMLSLTVSDDGKGFDPETHQRLDVAVEAADEFDMVSGIGLAIVKDIAEMYNGSMEVGSSHLGGAQITLRLPGGRSDAVRKAG